MYPDRDVGIHEDCPSPAGSPSQWRLQRRCTAGAGRRGYSDSDGSGVARLGDQRNIRRAEWYYQGCCRAGGHGGSHSIPVWKRGGARPCPAASPDSIDSDADLAHGQIGPRRLQWRPVTTYRGTVIRGHRQTGTNHRHTADAQIAGSRHIDLHGTAASEAGVIS